MGDLLRCIWPYVDPALGFQGMCDKVEQLQNELPNVHVLNQATNKANSEAHFRLTGMVVKCVQLWFLYLGKQISLDKDELAAVDSFFFWDIPYTCWFW